MKREFESGKRTERQATRAVHAPRQPVAEPPSRAPDIRACLGDKNRGRAGSCNATKHAARLSHSPTNHQEPGDAEDAAQQTMLNAFTHREQFRGQSSYITWLTRIAINEALGRLRRHRERVRRVVDATPESSTPVLETLPSPEDYSPDVVAVEPRGGASCTKPSRVFGGESRAIVWLLGIHERPIKEAAHALNISESAAKARFYRARRQLRECLAERV